MHIIIGHIISWTFVLWEGLVPSDGYIITSKTFKRSHIHTKALLLLLKKSFKKHKNCETAVMDLADLKDDIILSLNRTSRVNKSQIIYEDFHSEEDFFEATAHPVSHKKRKIQQKIWKHKPPERWPVEFPSTFCQVSFKTKTVMSTVTQWYLKHHPIPAQDLLHIGENLSGIWLVEALRKTLPGLLPWVTQEITAWRASKKSFWDVLPKRPATGFCVDPERLLEVMLQKYHYLVWDVQIRL